MKPYHILQRFCLSFLVVSPLLISLTFVPPAEAGIWDFWKELYSSRFPRRGLGGGRGDRTCLIAPSTPAEITQVWSERPTFVWQGGAIVRLEMVLKETDVIWEHVVSEADQIKDTVAVTDLPTYAVTMDEALQMGEAYKLRFYVSHSSEPLTTDLQVLSSQEHEQVGSRLEQLGGTDETTAIQRADYFAGQNLWLDFWQTVVAAPAHSEEWRNVNSNTIAALCPILETSGTLPAANSSEENSFKEHRFIGRVEQTVEIALKNPDFDTRLTLITPEGNEIDVMENVAGEQVNSKMMTLLEEGEYRVKVQALNLQRRGSYDLTIVSKFGAE